MMDLGGLLGALADAGFEIIDIALPGLPFTLRLQTLRNGSDFARRAAPGAIDLLA
ncbi:MAG TPA: hypothetical protein VGD37_24155 [Kofleriaceae bacterium]|jgi:hypothetical protein